MKLLVLSDIHGDIITIQTLVQSINDCDVIVIAGDITDFGGFKQADAVLSELKKSGLPVLAVPGNCDAPTVLEALTKHGSDLTQQPIPLDGVIFVGGGYPAKDNLILPNEPISKENSDLPLIFVTHEPAWDTDVDLQASTRHRGSKAVRSWIEHCQPLVAISGHIHEAFGTDQVGSTLLVNPGPLRNGRYAIIELNDNGANVTLHSL